jgi:D-alanine-D-alanine ligase
MQSGSNRQTVAVLFGGRSVEHEISIITALQLIEAIDTVKYNPIPVYIATSGKWYSGPALLKREFYKGMPGTLADVQEVVLMPVPGTGGLTVIQTKAAKSGFGLFGKPQQGPDVIPVDVYFPAFHGSYGENGCIQGLLELADVVYTGSDVVSSAVSMSKYHSKKFLESHDVPCLPSVLLAREGLDQDPGGKLESWRKAVLGTKGFEKFPLFVKPANLGSSIGVARVTDENALDAALLQAFKYDHQVLVEPCVEEKLEINVAVIDDVQVRASVVEIPVSSSGNELSYEDKYMRGGGKKGGSHSLGMAGLTRVIDPTDLDPVIKSQAQEFAVRAFTALGCAGVARIDFMMDLAAKKLYFNEINPLPGSLANYLWVKSAPPLLFTDLLSLCIERAIKRDKTKRALSHDVGFKALFK